MGAALTYARRYALFALVGIAGEDDLDSPDTVEGPSAVQLRSSNGSKGKQGKGALHRPPLLNQKQSAKLRDELLAEIRSLSTDHDLLCWARDGVARKNTLVEADAMAVEIAYERKLGALAISESGVPEDGSRTEGVANEISDAPKVGLAFPKEPPRKRSTAHLLFVRGQPCVICKQTPRDPHHLKFAQPRALGRKVSDEFTVPLCRPHHQDLHRHGNEKAWWANMQISPLPIAKELWDASPVQIERSVSETQPQLHRDLGSENATRYQLSNRRHERVDKLHARFHLSQSFWKGAPDLAGLTAASSIGI
jgi:hypothetical protein